MRTTYCTLAAGKRPAAKSKTTLRNRAKATLEQEAAAFALRWVSRITRPSKVRNILFCAAA